MGFLLVEESLFDVTKAVLTGSGHQEPKLEWLFYDLTFFTVPITLG